MQDFEIPPENIENLYNIGTKQEDFEEIKSLEDKKPYTILGTGNFGYAEKMKSKLNNKIYAIKKLPVKNDLSKNLLRDYINFIRETTFMLSLNNQYIVKLYGYFQGIEKIDKLKEIYKNHRKQLYQNDTNDKNMYFLVLDFMSNGNLEYLNESYRKQNKKLEQNFIIKIFKQLLIGLNYLHSNGIVHRDIKLDNILFDEKYDIKISDFGIAAQLNLFSNPSSPLKSLFTIVGRMDFAAPEIINNIKYDYKVDIFSLGLTMLCLISNIYPIKLKNKKRFIISKDIDIKMYNEYLIKLIKRMILENPSLRPNAKDAFEELNYIEIFINDPNNISAINFLKEKNSQSISFGKSNSSNIPHNNFNINNNQNITSVEPQKFANQQKDIISSSKSEIIQSNKLIGIEQFYPNDISQIKKEGKNRSIKCVLKCLYYCLLDDIDNIIEFINFANFNQESFNWALYFLNTIKLVGKNINSKKEIDNSNKYIQLFRNQISTEILFFKGINEIDPIFVYYKLFEKLNNEIAKYSFEIPDYLNNLNEIPGIDKIKFPNFYQDLNSFLTLKKSILTDKFYLIILDFVRCSECNDIIDAKIKWSFFIELDGRESGNISNLINKYFDYVCPNRYFYCKKCNLNVKGIKIEAFLTKPKYLVITFLNNDFSPKDLANEINLYDYSYADKNFGPNKYFLFAIIEKNQKNEFDAFIKKDNYFFFYDSEMLFKSSYYKFNNIFPFIVIYKAYEENNRV